MTSAGKAYALARGGHAEEARASLANLEPLSAGKPLAYDIAAIHAALGDPVQAFQWLTRAVAIHVSARSGLRVDPRFDSLHSSPQWEAILENIGPDPIKN